MNLADTFATVGNHSDYSDPAPTVRSQPDTVVFALPDLTISLSTDRGVFSGGAIDPGTRYLLLEGPRPEPEGEGALLDLGCGYGPIALALARRAPRTTVWAVDVNARARDLTRANAERAGLANVIVAAPDAVPPSVRFAGMWSNPPIRIGKPALHELLLTWLVRLEASAAAALVVHKHLGADSLARWLASQGFAVSRFGSRAGYRILAVNAT